MDINLHIEHLVLDGVNIAPNQNDLLKTSLVNELTRLLNNGGLATNLSEGIALDRVKTNSIQLNDGKPQRLGQQIAKSVFGGIGCG